MKYLALTCLFALSTPILADIGTGDCEECRSREPGILGSFGNWVTSWGNYLSGNKPAAPQRPSPQCPDQAMGRITRSNSIAARYLREIANIGQFDRALQRDPQVRSFLGNDPRLKAAQAGDRDLRACIAQGPTLKYLLGLDAGVDEGYDIGQHTERVLGVYLSQRQHYQPVSLADVSNKTLDRLMLPIMALHDIGKGIAVKAGNNELQHHFTGRFVRTYLQSAGFTQKEINVAVALIDHDTVGSFLKPGGISAQQARSQLQARARMAGMPYGEFMKLQQLFYTSDSAAYPFLRDLVFRQERNGRLTIKSSRLKQLL